MYVRSGYDGDQETVNVLTRHTALKRRIATEICSFPRVGCAKRGSSADFCDEAVILVRQATKSLPPPEKKHVTNGEDTVLGRLSRRRDRCSTSCL